MVSDENFIRINYLFMFMWTWLGYALGTEGRWAFLLFLSLAHLVLQFAVRLIPISSKQKNTREVEQ